MNLPRTMPAWCVVALVDAGTRQRREVALQVPGQGPASTSLIVT